MKNMPLQFLKLVMSLTVLSLAVLSLAALTPSAHAESVKADPMAAKGCMPRASVADAEAAIHRFNLSTVNARPQEIQTLGTALIWIEKLNDGRPLSRAIPAAGYAYNFQSAVMNSHQADNEIRVNRNGDKNYGENVAQLVHELGHLIGNRDPQAKVDPDHNAYAEYYDFVGPRYCVVSSYSDDNHHEQFAEVFAAFVTRPELLKNNPSPACKKAYQFFATKIFSNAGPTVLRCLNRQSTLEKLTH